MAIKKSIRELTHKKYNGRCAYCGCDITLKTMQVDHIKPKINGGNDDLENLNPACRVCNNWKLIAKCSEYEWQEIETAPKDGKQFLIVDALNKSDVFIAVYRKSDESFRETCDYTWIDIDCYTHWMFLPEPPELAQKALKGDE